MNVKQFSTPLMIFVSSLALGWLITRALTPGKAPPPLHPFDGPSAPPALRHAGNEWRQVADELDTLPSFTHQTERLLPRLATARPEDIPALLLLLEELDRELLIVFINHWLERDPAALARALESFPLTNGKAMDWAHEFYYRWAERDPKAAFAQATTTVRDLRHSAIHAIIMKRFDTDPDQALAWCAQVPADMISFSASGWAQRHPEQVLAQAETIRQFAPSPFRERLLVTAASEMAKTDVRAALAFTEHIGSTFQTSARMAIAGQWVKAEPDTARDFVETTSDLLLRAAVAAKLGEAWAANQPAEAIPWALRWLTGRSRQNVLQKAFVTLEKTDPAHAAALRETLPRPVPPRGY